MKIIQLNIWGGRLSKQVIAFLQAEQPDIVCMQEVFSCPDDVLVPDNQFTALEVIAAGCELPEVFFSPLFSLRYGNYTVQYGSAMIAKSPLLDRQTVFTKGQYVENIDPAASATSRDDGSYNLQIASVPYQDKTLTIANHHGFWQPDPIGNHTSIDGLQLVADRLAATDGPKILCGDLNVVAASPAMRVFDGQLRDLTAEFQLANTLGQLHFLKTKPVACDHILVSDEIQVDSFGLADPLASDHQALVLEFSL